MSKKRNNLLLLKDIFDAIKNIEEYLLGYDDEAFYRDKKTKDAVVRNFEIIGDASGQHTSDFKALHSEIEWREISDLGNKIIHKYFGVDYVILWEIIQMDLPSLRDTIFRLIGNFPSK